MRYFEFRLATIDPTYTPEELSQDLTDVFLSFEENTFVESVDIVSTGGQSAGILIGTGILTETELEAMLIAKFSEAGRNPQNYLLLPLGEQF